MLEIYGSIGIVAGIAQAVYVVTAFCLGAQLVARARGPGGEHRLLLGLHLLLAMGVGYVLLSMAMVVEMHAVAPPRAVLTALVGAGYLATIAGLAATLVFNARVFHPRSGWGRALAWGIGSLMLFGWAGYGAVEGFPAAFDGPWLWTMLTGILAANAWVAFEPLRYHERMRRRARLGLAEPLVANRFLLWGSGSLARVLMVLAGPLALDVMRGLDTERALMASSVVLTVASALGLFTSVAYWLTFFPSSGYARWIERRYAAATRPA